MRLGGGAGARTLLLAASLAAAAGPAAPRAARAEEVALVDPAGALEIARAAFEYRDFQKVIDTLFAWVHPPRIPDDAQMIDARRLLGVSFHVLGDTKSAREEFAQLLLADPRHKLDPFVVPPKVIETFEAVRREMRPTLDRVLAERGMRPDPGPSPAPAGPIVVEVPSRWVTLLPGGVPQFALEEPAWGGVLGGGQLAGLALNFTGYFVAQSLSPEEPAFEGWRATQYVGLGLAVAAYAASVIWANVSYDGYREAHLERGLQVVTQR